MSSKWQKQHPVRALATQRAYHARLRAEHPERVLKRKSTSKRRKVEELADSYVREALAKGSGIPTAQLPQELIDMKREAMRLKRLARQLTRATKEIVK